MPTDFAALAREYAVNPKAAKGIWDRYKDEPHPHAACVADFSGKVDDAHAFCAAVEKEAAGTTPAERAAKKDHAYSNSIEGVELFATGTHNGDKYTEEDLDAIVEAFGKLDFKPPLKAGHGKDVPGMPALGWVANLRRVGSKLIADFSHMPDVVYQAIKDRRYNTVSAEIYWNLKRGGDAFRRALKAVALLGAEIPAVAGLRPLHEHFHADETVEVKYASDTPLRPDEGESAGSNHANNTEVNMTEAEIKALQDQVAAAQAAQAAAEAKVAELTKKETPKGDGGLEEILKRVTGESEKVDVKQLAQALVEAERIAKTAREEKEALAKRTSEDAERIAKLEREQRYSMIEKIAESCRIPALRPFIKQYLDLATREPDVRVFSENEGKQIPAAKAVEELVSYVNQNAARLFTAYSRGDDNTPKSQDAGKDVDIAVKKYQQANPNADYAKAMEAVLASDPELKSRYVHQIAHG